MKNLLIISLISCFTISCQTSPSKNDNSTEIVKTDTIRVVDTVYLGRETQEKQVSNFDKKQFNTILSNLTYDENFITSSISQLKSEINFGNNCDVLFKHYFDTIPALVYKVYNESFITKGDYDSDWDISEKDIPKFNEKGFIVQRDEGNYYPMPDYEFIKNKFGSCISNDLSIYLLKVSKEDKEGYMDDASFSVSFSEIAKRMIYRYNLIQNNPNFILIDDCKSSFISFKSAILYGSDNSPVFDWSTKKLTKEAQEAYRLVINELKDEALGQKFNSYFEALKANNFKRNQQTDKLRNMM